MPQDLFVIGDTDTVIGFGYAGVPGTVVTTADEARNAFDQVRREHQVKILIITESAASLIREEVDRERFDAVMPVVVEVPGPEGPHPDRRTLMELIRQAIGIGI